MISARNENFISETDVKNKSMALVFTVHLVGYPGLFSHSFSLGVSNVAPIFTAILLLDLYSGGMCCFICK